MYFCLCVPISQEEEEEEECTPALGSTRYITHFFAIDESNRVGVGFKSTGGRGRLAIERELIIMRGERKREV